MARSEARIFTSIWKDPDFLALSPSAQRLYMFLLSQDDLTYSGVMPLRERRWASKAAGMTVTDVEQDLKALESSDRRFIVADRDTGELLIRSLIRRDGVWKQPNLLKLARESAEQVESQRIRDALLVELRRLPLHETGSDLVKRVVDDFIQDLDEGSAYPTAYPHPDPSDDPSGNPMDDPIDNPSDNHYARARGSGEGYGGEEVSPDPGTPEPLTDLSAPPARDRKLGTRLPDDFAVTAEMVNWARANAPHVDGKRETERFADYWHAKPGKDGRKLDWVRTWRNWMRTAEDRQGPRERASPNGSRPSTTDQRIADTQALKARLTGRQESA